MFEKRKAKKTQKQFDQEFGLAVGIETERFARASVQHFSAHSELQKNAQSKINPDYAKTNIQQQAGFAAETKHVARTNAENIIDGNSERIARTDNVGAVNHPKYDTVKVDSQENPIRDSSGNYVGGAQQKTFSKVENYDKLYSKDYEHYKDTPIDIPPDQHPQVIERWNNQVQELEEQKQVLQQRGDTAKANQIQRENR